jgi:hypothetical protein
MVGHGQKKGEEAGVSRIQLGQVGPQRMGKEKRKRRERRGVGPGLRKQPRKLLGIEFSFLFNF